jgi:trimeric autotransporter adhesin
MRRVLLISVVAVTAFLSACGGGSQSTSSNPVLQSLQVSGASAQLAVGQTQQMKATGTYSTGTSQDVTSSATWTSSDSTVATVAAGGLVTAKAAGSCSITAKIGSVTGSFNVTVAPGLVSLSVTPANASIAPGTAQQFTATGTYSDGSQQNLTGSASWASSNTAIATVSTTSPTRGLAQAVASGSVTITATSGSVSGTATLNVSSATATSIAVTPLNANLPLGLAQQYKAVGTFSDGTSQDLTGVATWKSSVTSVASITTSGLATGKNVGSTTISASFESATGSTSLTVNAANLNSISIQPANGSIAQGTRLQFAAIGTFNNGGTFDITHQVTWSSSDTTIATIGASNGVLFGVAPGLVTITAGLGSVTTSVPLTVTGAKIVSISITPSSATTPIGGRKHFAATGTFDDSSTQDLTATAAWASDNTAVATVGSTSGSYGVATGITAGNANISAGFSYAGANATGTAALTVNTATLTSINLTPTSALLAPASSLQYSAIGVYSDGSTQYISPYVTWTSSSPSVAIVSTAGVATGESAGTTTITAQSGSVSATANLVVEGAALNSIQITPHSSTVPATIDVQFTATGTFANGDVQDLTSAATWTSSVSSIATISNAQGSIGLAMGVAPGTVTISAVFSGQVGTATLTVTSATLNSISVTPASATIPVGGSQQFNASGTFSNGSVIGITAQAAWTSSDVNVATMSGHGLATGGAAGTATIKASMNGVNGTAILTVQ